MKVSIVDYQLSNLHSVKSACDVAEINSLITSNKEDIINSDGLIIPGVGSFKDAMKNIKDLNLYDSIVEFIENSKPVLAVCLGMQILFSSSEEFGYTEGFGLLNGKIKKFIFKKDFQKYPVPHTGWNKINFSLDHQNIILTNIENNSFMYFVHSYYLEFNDKNNNHLMNSTYANTAFCAGVRYKNLTGFQFHPEKSGLKGLLIYKNFKRLILNDKQNIL
jgi:glutamine amidotransferase